MPRWFRAAGKLLLLWSLIQGLGHAQTAHPPEKAGVREDRPPSADFPLRSPPTVRPQDSDPLARDFRFAHLTTKDGLSQAYVTTILQDRRGFMWFATRDGLNRYDGYTFVVYKHVPEDPGSLNSNFIQHLMEDDRGHLWITTNTGLNRFDPTTERTTRFLHDPNNPNTIGGASVTSIANDGDRYIWLATADAGVDKLDTTTGTFTHYPNDSDGRFVGRITQVIQDRQREVWFVG